MVPVVTVDQRNPAVPLLYPPDVAPVDPTSSMVLPYLLFIAGLLFPKLTLLFSCVGPVSSGVAPIFPRMGSLYLLL